MSIFSQSETYDAVCSSLERTIFRQNTFWVVTLGKPSHSPEIDDNKANAAVIMLTDYEH